jgi:hypothetical protein
MNSIFVSVASGKATFLPNSNVPGRDARTRALRLL